MPRRAASAGGLLAFVRIEAVVAHPLLEAGHLGPQSRELIGLPGDLARLLSRYRLAS